MRRLSVLALLLASLVVSALPASAAEEKDHFQAHLKATDAAPDGTNPQGQASFWFEEENGGLVMRCTLTVAAVYDASSIRLLYHAGGTDETVMHLFTPTSGFLEGRRSGQAIKDASPWGTPFYDVSYFLTDSPIQSFGDLREAMQDGEISVTVLARQGGNDVVILSGEVR